MIRLIIASALILVVVLAGCGGDTEPVEVIKEVTVEVIKEVTVEVPVTVIVEATPEISDEMAEAILEAVLSDTPTPIVGVGARKSPVPFNQVTQHDTSRGHLVEIALLQYERGEKALEILNPEGADEFDLVEPEEGQEFVAARFWIKNASDDMDEPLYLSASDFSISVNNRSVDSYWDINYEIGLYEELYSEGEAEGWTAFEIPVGANVEAIRYYNDVLEDGIWFAVE